MKITEQQKTDVKLIKEQICPECQILFVPYNNRKNIIFCSYDCQVKFNIRKRRLTRQENLKASNPACNFCQQNFTPKSSDQIFCSDLCRDKFKYIQKQSKKTLSKNIIKCHICHSNFIPHSQKSKYCSAECRRTAKNELLKIRNQNNGSKSQIYRSEYRKKNNIAVKKYRLKNWYGISLDGFNKILLSQDSKCSICKKELYCDRDTHLDHDHSPGGQVRGILCSACNTGIGHLQDNPDLLRKAAEYLEKYNNKNLV